MPRRQRPTLPVTVPFPMRAAHEARLDQTDAIGPQLASVDHADLVPSLPHLPDVMTAAAALQGVPLPTSQGIWFKMDKSSVRPDGRALWRADHHHADAARITSGYILIGPDPTEQQHGTFATLLIDDEHGSDKGHALVASKNGKVVRFDSREDAQKRLATCVMADGTLPDGLSWEGDPYLPIRWLPGKPGSDEIYWMGRKGRWTIYRPLDDFTVSVGRIRRAERFSKLIDAKQFVETEDAK